MAMCKYLHPSLLTGRYALLCKTQYGRRFFGVKADMNKVKVSVLGAAGGIGQPLSLLMKMNPKVGALALYDIVNVNGVAADLSHIDTSAEVTTHHGQSTLGSALKGSDLVIIPAGVPRKPGMTRDDLFSINSGILMSLANYICDNAKNAFILVITNPVNSTLPIFSEVMKKNNCYNPKKLFGVSKLDNARASTFLSQANQKPAGELKVNVVGGHSGNTIVPLISQLGLNLDQSTIEALTHRIQFAGDEVVKAKDGAGSATLSMAYSGASFANSIIEAIVSGKDVTEVAYINHDSFKELHGLDFFAARIDINKNGVSKVHDIGHVSKYESELISKAVSQLKIDIEKGISFAKSKLSQ